MNTVLRTLRVLQISRLRQLYVDSVITPLEVVDEVLRRVEAYPDPAVWICRVDADGLRAAAMALGSGPPPEGQPLWGIPFAVKDNIDTAGLPTTAACPAYAYQPEGDAHVVARLRASGALLVGKTNLDQFATGLNGTRSPHGAPRCVFDARYISGGSSSGSAVAVAAGLVSFSLGTDTAGSGRVPAAFNNLVGIKPTRGLLSTRGVVPACRSLDCVSVFALTAADGDLVRRVAEGVDALDPLSRAAPPSAPPGATFRFGVLAKGDRDFDGDESAAALYETGIARLAALGGEAVPFDYTPFAAAAALLYAGPWVAERLSALRGFLATNADDFDPSVRAILEAAEAHSAADLFAAEDRLRRLQLEVAAQWRALDVLLLPTAPTSYTVEAMQADPVALNARLGRYTNFVNLLDCAAVAVPVGFDSRGLPLGITLVGPAFSDARLAVLAGRLHHAVSPGLGVDRDATVPAATAVPVDDDALVIAVVGAHLSGMPLNHQLTAPGGRRLECTRTAGDYRLYALPDTTPPKPGLLRVPGSAGAGLEVELWSLPAAAFGNFVAAIPSPLGIGKLQLEDGRWVSGFICEAHAVAGAEDITRHGGWRAYVAQRRAD